MVLNALLHVSSCFSILGLQIACFFFMSGGLHAPPGDCPPGPEARELANADAGGHDGCQAHRLRPLQALRAGPEHAAGGGLDVLRRAR